MGSSDDSGGSPRAAPIPKPPVLPPKGDTVDDGPPPPKLSDADIPFSPTLTPPPEATPPGDDDLLELPAIDPKRYAVQGVVGRGGLGVILKARDRVLDRTVAIKRGQRRDDVATTRFVREALVTARLQHPSIVPVYDAGRWTVDEADPFYAMKLVDGKPLSQKVTTTTTLEERMALLPNVIAVADALAYAHGERIIHRDLKPDNVLVGEFGETVVIDWGLAKDLAAADSDDRVATPYQVVAQGLTVDGAIMGTPEYMAPEQARGDAVDERADVYALGGLLYFVLVGEAPFRGTSKDEIIAHILEQQLAPLEQRHPHIPHDLAVIVTKAMQRDPKARYRTAKEMAEDLRRFQTGQLVSARNYTTWELIRRWAARNRRVIALSMMFVLLLIGVVVFYVRRLSIARDDAELSALHEKEAKARAESRSRDLILANATSNLLQDPTTTVAYLKQYPSDGEHWAEVFELAIAAQHAGVARNVVEHSNAAIAALSSDGRIAASAGNDKQIKIWDARTGARLGAIDNPDGVSQIALSADGRFAVFARRRTDDVYLAPLPDGPAVKLWHAGDVQAIVISPDGRFVASGGEELHVHDRQLGRSTTIAEPTSTIAFTNDDRMATGGARKQVRIRDARTGIVERELATTESIAMVAFSSDGKRLAIAGATSLLEVWDGSAEVKLAHPGGNLLSFAFSADGKQLVALFDTAVHAWATDGARSTRTIPVGTVTAMTYTGQPIGFSRDGMVLVLQTTAGLVAVDIESAALRVIHPGKHLGLAIAAAGDRIIATDNNGALRIWDHDRSPMWRTVFDGGEVTGLAFSPDGNTVVSASTAGLVETQDLGSRITNVLARFDDDAVDDLVFSPDGRWLAGSTWGNTVKLWNQRTGGLTTLEHPSGETKVPVFTPDSRLLISAAQDGLRVLDLATQQVTALPQPDALAIDVSPDGSAVVVGDRNGTVAVWDLATKSRRVVGAHDKGAVGDVHYIGPATIVSASSAAGDTDNTVRLWTPTGNRVLLSTRSAIRKLAISRDGRAIAVSTQDGTLYRCDPVTAKPEILGTGQKPIRALAFSPDGQTLASGNDDGVVRLWRGRASQIVYQHVAMVRAIAFSGDGTRLASASNDRTAWVGVVHPAQFLDNDRAAIGKRLADLTAAVLVGTQTLTPP